MGPGFCRAGGEEKGRVWRFVTHPGEMKGSDFFRYRFSHAGHFFFYFCGSVSHRR